MNIAEMDSTLIEQIWTVVSCIEWTEADWRDFYESLTIVFTRIAVRHAKIKINEAQSEDKLEHF